MPRRSGDQDPIVNEEDDFLPGGFGELLRQAQELQEQMLAAQDELAATEFEGQAGGGLVRITVTGDMQFRSVHIEPDAVDPEDVGMLEDLVLAALHDAVGQARNVGPGGPDGGLPGLPGGFGGLGGGLPGLAGGFGGLGGVDLLGGGSGLGAIEELFDQLMGGQGPGDYEDYEDEDYEDEDPGAGGPP